MTDIKPGYLRVTEILSAFSGLNKIDPETLRNASLRGNCVHMAIDSIVAHYGRFGLEERVLEYSGECRYEKELSLVNNMVDSFEKWAEGKKFLPKPMRLYDDDLKITGEFDMIEVKDGFHTLVDFKTPMTESKTWCLQASAYWILAAANGIKIDRIEFVKLCRKGNAPRSFFYSPNPELFKAVLETYKYFELDGVKDLEIDFI